MFAAFFTRPEIGFKPRSRDDEHAIALVRFESPDDSADDDGAGGGKVKIIDTVLVTPVGVPPQMRAPLKDAVVASLRAIGEANKMTVRMWSDYDA